MLGEEESAWLSAKALDMEGILPKVLMAIKLSWSLVSGGNMGRVDLLFWGVPVLYSLSIWNSSLVSVRNDCFQQQFLETEVLTSIVGFFKEQVKCAEAVLGIWGWGGRGI